MAQKANLTSLKRLNFLPPEYSLNNRIFLLSKQFLEAISQILKIKNVLVVSKTINFTGSTAFINLSVFFKSAKLKKISRFLIFKKLTTKKTKQNSKFKELIKNVFEQYKISSLKLKFTVLNFLVNKKVTKFCLKNLKKYFRLLFTRRLKLFFDFSQIITLYTLNYLTTKFLIYNIALIFSRLKKQRHSKFLTFIKDLFELIIFDLPTKFKIKKHKIGGVKFILQGKIRGKTRKKTKIITVGTVPTSATHKQVEFAKIATVTSYGVFGLKLWIYRTS
jgi:hypothetical protein